ncbi:MAG: hypothetical protein AAFX45_11955 [Pseudomonadota bacterium]
MSNEMITSGVFQIRPSRINTVFVEEISRIFTLVVIAVASFGVFAALYRAFPPGEVERKVFGFLGIGFWVVVVISRNLMGYSESAKFHAVKISFDAAERVKTLAVLKKRNDAERLRNGVAAVLTNRPQE